MSQRRLSACERIALAWSAYQCQGIYGAITDLARSYGVSRWLVYHLLWTLIPLMLTLAEPKVAGPRLRSHVLQVDKRHIDRAIVSLRLEANASLEGIQRSLETILGTHRSIGYISQVIQQAQQEATAFQQRITYEVHGVGMPDELFVGETPLLITVEPNSTVILRLTQAEQRDGATWAAELSHIEADGFQFEGVTSDAATGIARGVQTALGAEMPHQLDIGHLFREVARVDSSLERSAYKALSYEEARARVLESARSERVIAKRIAQWEQAHQVSEQAIRLYDDFHYLTGELVALLTPIDTDGVPRNLLDVQADLEALSALLAELGCACIQDVRKRLVCQQDGLLVFWSSWEASLAQLRQAIGDEDLLHLLLLEYFLKRKKKLASARQQMLSDLEAFLGSYLGLQADAVRKHVANVLDNLHRSSAMVENANSRLRPYLDTRKGVSQGFLDLLWLYLNCKCYRRGKRKGNTPFELLGVQVPDDWLQLLGLPKAA